MAETTQFRCDDDEFGGHVYWAEIADVSVVKALYGRTTFKIESEGKCPSCGVRHTREITAPSRIRERHQ